MITGQGRTQGPLARPLGSPLQFLVRRHVGKQMEQALDIEMTIAQQSLADCRGDPQGSDC